MKQRISAISLIFSLTLLTTLADAGTYKWIDKDGNVVYSQQPPPEGSYESIRLPKQAGSRPPASPKQSSIIDQARELDVQKENDAKVQAELEKNLALRKKNCETAKQQLKIYTVYKRIPGKDGQSHRITEQEREAGLKEAKQGIKDYCD